MTRADDEAILAMLELHRLGYTAERIAATVEVVCAADIEHDPDAAAWWQANHPTHSTKGR
jgi:hypothetical protein